MKRSSRPLLRCIGHGLLTLLLVLQASMVLALGGAGCATAAVTVTASEAAATPPCHPATPASGLPAGNPAAGEDCLAGGGTWCAWACSLAASALPLPIVPVALPPPGAPDAPPTLLASRALPVPLRPPAA
ncbi:hypothetical protein [Silanimonas sp.]|uniref:hypothetical protein n=1 Tax=Silanimonas sp. TaxID=1929290 RepID=UPI001BC072A2|nr:hypothetical protein [Silanimonas sp.]MBS3896928.1 hypothetical protein [Silanimonas sp.]